MHADLHSLALSISQKAYLSEKQTVESLISRVDYLDAEESRIMQDATRMVEKVRAEGLGVSAEAFLQQYGLNTTEGVAIMCLAEALLRIPDSETADSLIRDTFDGTNWQQHLGKSDNLFVNASGWGLMLTGKAVNFGAAKPDSVLRNLFQSVGEPTIRAALKQGMKFIGSQFVLGETIEDALKNSKPMAKKSYRFSYDILGEGARTDAQAMGYVNAYHHAIGLIGKEAAGMNLFHAPSISVKLSALHPRYSFAQRERVLSELAPRLIEILLRAKEANITVALDAEESTRLDIEMELFAHIVEDSRLAGWNGIGFVVQAYQKRCFALLDFLGELARRTGRILPVRLVKGAYWDSEVKWSQIQGLPDYPVFTRKEHTDVSYLACADKLLQSKDIFYSQFATHNARTIASINAMANRYSVGKNGYEFQRLHGMGEKLHDQVVTETPSRIYAPVGEHKDLLAYLIRRLLENGANTSFVNLLMDADTAVSELLADPVAKSRVSGGLPNPSIPAPLDLYRGARANSAGLDFGNRAMVEAFEASLSRFDQTRWSAEPLISGVTPAGPETTRYRPAEHSLAVGTVRDATIPELQHAITQAQKAFGGWAARSVDARATNLETLANLFEKHREELIALCVHEAGKTLADGIAEVREAIDFCRYYAHLAREVMQPEPLVGPTGESNLLSLHPRGVFGCISPWNFPLAIFTGQVVAALVTGNCVIAKPAEQTPLIAYRAVQLMHEAGIPDSVIQLVPGNGETIGDALVKDPRITGIVFTGSSEVARIINESLARRAGAIAPLIAETGGMNAMVIDSSALLEQALDDVILSAFGSAGQRCSALRVLYVQEDIADALITLIKGAMQELRVGLPRTLSTDIGPVIDKEAQSGLLSHIERMKKEAAFLCATPLALDVGYFVAPHAFEIPHIKSLAKEIFGPVLHIVRFKQSQMQQVIDDINSTGYGLTFGIYSRIEEHITLFTSRIRAGNLYVNRSMIGATVGVQPFGGEGLSGTGPKAGGPHYLHRFLTERTTTINTSAIGGNLELLSGK
jgi:RHH-type proline utilization regulon transcriptional repressor/proline dehydrogenase/delta 1-pyrroline-5-carboxylate dehydrogenase